MIEAARPGANGSPPLNRLLLAAACLLALAGCRQASEAEPAARPSAEQTMPSPTSDATPPGAATPSESAVRALYDQLAALPSDAELQRLRAAAALAALQGEVDVEDYGLVPSLRALLDHEPASVRAAAVDLLGALIAAAGRDGGQALPAVDKASVRPQLETATTAVIDHLDDRDDSVRLAAVKALRHAESPRLFDALLARLGDASPLVRFQALTALQDRDTSGRTAAAARGLLQDPDEQVRKLAEIVAGDASP